MPSACNNKRKSVCGLSACNKKTARRDVEGPWVRSSCFLLCRASYSVPGMKTIPSFFVVRCPRYQVSHIRHITTKASGTRYKNMNNDDNIDTYVIPVPRYQVWLAIRTPQWVRTKSSIPANILYLQVNLARGGTTARKLWYQREIPFLAWTSPVQLQDTSRASSTNPTRFWTQAEV